MRSLAVGSHNGRQLLAAAFGYTGVGRVELWDVSDPAHPTLVAPLVALSDYKPYMAAIAFSPDGKLIAAGGDDREVTLWDASGTGAPRLLGSVDVEESVRSLSFNADSTRLAVASDSGLAELKGPGFVDGEPMWLDDAQGVFSVAYASDGSLAYGLNDSSRPGIVMLDPSGERQMLLTTTTIVRALAFTADGTVLLSGGDDANVTTWDAKTGRPFGPPRTEEGTWPVYAVAISPDGRSVAGAGSAGTVKLWSLTVSQPLATTIGSLGPQDRANAGE